MRKEKIPVGALVTVTFTGEVDYYDSGGSETYGINPLLVDDKVGKYIASYHMVTKIQPEWVTLSSKCLHDTHVVTFTGMSLGQKIGDGPTWVECKKEVGIG